MVDWRADRTRRRRADSSCWDRTPVAAVTGLTVFTIRDRVTAGCYTLFALDPAQSAPGPAAAAITEEPTAEQLESVRVAQLLKDAIAERNRRIVDLQTAAA